MTTEPPKRFRRFFRYRLRTLMLVVTVFCIWLGITVIRARNQRQAVEAILALGGTIRYEHEVENARFGGLIVRPDLPGPEWLRPLVGDEYFFRVRQITLNGSKVDDTNVAVIRRLTGAVWLSLSFSEVADESMLHVKSLSNLDTLDLNNTQIADGGLLHLKSLTNLRTLNLTDTQITDAGLAQLKGMANLQMLYLKNTQVSDAGLVHLEGLAKLQWLDVQGTRVTGDGIEKLELALPKLLDIVRLRNE